MRIRQWSMAMGLAAFAAQGAAGCVLNSTHDATLADLAKTQGELSETKTSLGQCTQERDALDADKKALDEELTKYASRQAELNTQLASLQGDLEEVLGQKGAVEGEKERLTRQLEELAKLSQALERRNADYRNLLEKLREMMDAGTLSVRIRNGLMVVQMPSDIVFPPGGIRIKKPAREALESLAITLASFEGRRFQVVGHSDNQPIRTKRFPSNWELSTQRSVEVVRLLIKNGVEPTMISAAGAAENDPLADNETVEGRASNRRVEIVFVPKIDEMPGFKEALSK